MQREDEAANSLLETLRRELASIIDEDPEDYKSNIKEENNTTLWCDNESEICLVNRSSLQSSKDKDFSKKDVLNISSISNINGCIEKLQNNLDESCKMFRAIAECFENINFGCLKMRIKDLNLCERSSHSIKLVIKDLRQSFDEKYVEKRLDDLTREVSSKFRNHPGEFADIPELSEFFRTCTKLEHGLAKLRQQRDDCMYLQKRMTRVAEASYDRVNFIQQKIMTDNEEH